jgi:hypothetical protein
MRSSHFPKGSRDKANEINDSTFVAIAAIIVHRQTYSSIFQLSNSFFGIVTENTNYFECCRGASPPDPAFVNPSNFAGIVEPAAWQK